MLSLLASASCIEEVPFWEPGGASSTGAASASEGTAGAASESSGGTTTETIDVAPSIVACSDPNTLDPDICLGSETLTVDAFDNAVNAATTGFLRFDFEEQASGAEVTEASLFLTVAGSTAPQSGEIWLTEVFGVSDLTEAQPMTVGDIPLSPTQFDVQSGQTLEFVLPASAVVTPLCLAIVPTDDDGVEYWAMGGDVPPRLTLTLQR